MTVDKYEPSYDFSDDLGSTHGLRLDIEFENISSKTGELSDALDLIQRSDGKLRDLVVDVHTLSRDVMNLLGGYLARGSWASATVYAVNDIVDNSGYAYVCKTAHTSSGSFAGDAANWLQFGFGPSSAAQATADSALNGLTAHLAATVGAHDASGVAYAGGGNLSPSSVEAAIDALDSGKAPLASPVFTGTPTAPTAAPGSANSQVANTAFVASAVASVASGGATLDSLGAILNKSVVKSTSDNVGASHKGNVFRCSATLTLALTAAATLGDGFAFAVFPESGAIVTIDPSGSEMIDGLATKTFSYPAIIYCNGVGFASIESPTPNKFVSSFNSRKGEVYLSSSDVINALGYAPSANYHTHSYADLTAFVGASSTKDANSGIVYIRLTRANGSYLDVATAY